MTTGTELLNNKFRKNILMAILAQLISFSVSLLMSIVIPRYMEVAEYGYWQLFIFCLNYVGLSHFGWVDGIYLRSLGKDYNKLDYSLYGTQFWLLIVQQTAIAAVVISIGCRASEQDRIFIYCAVAIYMILYNLSYYLGYIFQATNRTEIYSKSVIIDKAIYFVFLLILVGNKCTNYKLYIVFYFVSRVVALGYCMIKGKNVIGAKATPSIQIFKEIYHNTKVGVNLVVGNLAGSFVIGCGRMVVDWHWGIEAFSIFSLSVTLVNFFLTFIGQISMVLLPALKCTNEKKQIENFDKIRILLPVILLGLMVGYVPGKVILSFWLPQYRQSLVYMVILLPICIFDGKMQLVNNVYLKILRKEDIILKINLICVGAAVILSVGAAVILESTEMVMAVLTAVIVIRSICAEKYLEKLLKANDNKTIGLEILLCFIFVIANLNFSEIKAFIIYGVCYIVCITFNIKRIKMIYN